MNNVFRAKKKLGILDSFEILEKLPEGFNQKVTSNLMGELVGVYRNCPESIEDSVVVFENGLQVIGRDSTDLICYREIRDIESPKDKVSRNPLNVTLKSGQKFAVPIRNGKGNIRDLFSFLDFLKCVSQWYDGSWH